MKRERIVMFRLTDRPFGQWDVQEEKWPIHDARDRILPAVPKKML